MKEVTREWLVAALDDLKTISHLENDDALTHILAFHAQQCIEKSLKAIIEEKELGALKIHNLRCLFGLCEKQLAINEADKDLIAILDSLYLNARYPGERGLLPDGKPTLAEAKEYGFFAKRIHDQASEVLKS